MSINIMVPGTCFEIFGLIIFFFFFNDSCLGFVHHFFWKFRFSVLFMYYITLWFLCIFTFTLCILFKSCIFCLCLQTRFAVANLVWHLVTCSHQWKWQVLGPLLQWSLKALRAQLWCGASPWHPPFLEFDWVLGTSDGKIRETVNLFETLCQKLVHKLHSLISWLTSAGNSGWCTAKSSLACVMDLSKVF